MISIDPRVSSLVALLLESGLPDFARSLSQRLTVYQAEYAVARDTDGEPVGFADRPEEQMREPSADEVLEQLDIAKKHVASRLQLELDLATAIEEDVRAIRSRSRGKDFDIEKVVVTGTSLDPEAQPDTETGEDLLNEHRKEVLTELLDVWVRLCTGEEGRSDGD